MELEHIEFTLEDILAIHRKWIAKLYVEDRKTDAEISQLLSRQRLIVTVEQVRKCIKDWELKPLPLPLYPSMPELDRFLSSSYTTHTPNPTSRSHPPTKPNPNSTPRIFTSLINSSQTTKSPSINLDITPIHPPDQELYSKRPLPRIPRPKSISQSTTESTSPPPPQECIHGYSPSECPEVRLCLQCLPTTGPSSLDLYTGTVQPHEKMAVSLSRDEDQRTGKQVDESAVQMLVRPTGDRAMTPDSAGEESGVYHEVSYIRAKDTTMGRTKVGRVRLRKQARCEKDKKRKRRATSEENVEVHKEKRIERESHD